MFSGFPGCCTTYYIDWSRYNGRKSSDHFNKIVETFGFNKTSGGISKDWVRQINAVAYVVAVTKHRDRSKNIFLERMGFTHMASTSTEHFWWIKAPDLVKAAEEYAKDVKDV